MSFPSLSLFLLRRAKASTAIKASRAFSTQANGANRKTFEPDYLDAGGFLPPALAPINLQLRGYDFHILEKYQSFVHNLCENSGIRVGNCWSTPCTKLGVNTFNVGGTIVKDSYELKMYERNVQLTGLRTVDAGFLMDLLVRTLPSGVMLSAHEHEHEMYEARFIPDPFIEALNTEISSFDADKTSEKEKMKVKKLQKDEKRKETILASLE